MEKRSPKLSLTKEKVQSSCIWGLVDIFDFRNGRSNQKLLTNGGRRVQKEVSDFEHSRKVHTTASCCGKSQSFEGGAVLAMHGADAFEESIKNLMKQKFGNSKKSMKKKKASKKQLKNSDFDVVNQLQDDHKKPSKRSKESDQIQIQQWKDKFLLGPEHSSCSAKISLDKHNLEAICEEICSQIYQEKICGEDIEKVTTTSKYNDLHQVNIQPLQIAAKAFVDQIYINMKHNHTDGVSSKSKYFSDALEILNLNMDLFLKLLQDQNSLLLRSIQNLQFPSRDKERMKFYLDSRPSECESGGTRNDQDPEDAIEIQKRSSDNSLWKKVKYRYGCSSKEHTTSLASNKIVILTSRSTSKKNLENVSCHCSSQQAHQGLKNKDQIIKSTYLFKEIKRKFKQAVGENQQKQHWISMDESLRRLARNKHLLKDVDKGKSSDSGKGKSTFSQDSKKRDKQQKLVYLTSSNRSKTAPSDETFCEDFNSSSGSCSKQRQLDIFMEAKRHLSERLRNVDMGEMLPRKEAPRTLKMILSSPEHDFLTTPSPKRDRSASISAHMTSISPYYNTQLITANSLEKEIGKEMNIPCPLQHTQEVSPCDFRRCDDQLEISEFTPEISKKLQADPEVMENIYSIKDDVVPNGSANILKADDVLSQKSSNVLAVPYELTSTETTNKYEENGYMGSSHSTIPSVNHPHGPLLGSSRSLNIHGLEIVVTAKYKEEHASPVSVLEPFSPEDVYSPTSIMSKPDKSSLQPRRIAFDDYAQVVPPEDPKINPSACMDMGEPLHVYVKAAMEASELSFNNEIYLKGPSPQDVLYTCIADIMGLYPVESYDELRLLFDCIHEVLLGTYESYFGYTPWLSFLRQKIRSVPLEKDMVDEIVKEVNLHLFPKMEQPTLDQLVAKDIPKSGSWLDLCLDTEDILIQIAEDVLQDSIEDTILEGSWETEGSPTYDSRHFPHEEYGSNIYKILQS